MLLAQRLSISKLFHIKYQHEKVLQLEECITSRFKINLNISVICKTIKIEILTKGN